jgi:hypothetical protein
MKYHVFPLKKDNTDLLEEISKRLQTLDITNIASPSQTKEQTNQFKRINTIDKIKQDKPKIEEYILNLQDQFKDSNINRIANERNFHTKPLRSRIARTRYPENVSITRNFYCILIVINREGNIFINLMLYFIIF